ncbi:hypothetical protein RJT34_11542 [Clitoria ternatea]|uniref:Uncharacterized protein n=1 Tax=Clitoria ternatea TaxID=43366 RepID=A0AAN9PK58_CLITE
MTCYCGEKKMFGPGLISTLKFSSIQHHFSTIVRSKHLTQISPVQGHTLSLWLSILHSLAFLSQVSITTIYISTSISSPTPFSFLFLPLN